MEDNIIQEGVELMAVGMGVVFAFLVLLVVFMNLSGAFFTKFSHWFSEPQAPAPPVPRQANDTVAKVAVAIAVAHRSKYDSK